MRLALVVVAALERQAQEMYRAATARMEAILNLGDFFLPEV